MAPCVTATSPPPRPGRPKTSSIATKISASTIACRGLSNGRSLGGRRSFTDSGFGCGLWSRQQLRRGRRRSRMLVARRSRHSMSGDAASLGQSRMNSNSEYRESVEPCMPRTVVVAVNGGHRQTASQPIPRCAVRPSPSRLRRSPRRGEMRWPAPYDHSPTESVANGHGLGGMSNRSRLTWERRSELAARSFPLLAHRGDATRALGDEGWLLANAELIADERAKWEDVWQQAQP